jgi:hypothetical protein
MTSTGIPVIPSSIDHFEISTVASPVTAGRHRPRPVRAITFRWCPDPSRVCKYCCRARPPRGALRSAR